MTTFPDKIKFVEDSTEAKLIGVIPSKKEQMAEYKFTKSKTNKGGRLTLQLSEIKNLLDNDRITIK